MARSKYYDRLTYMHSPEPWTIDPLSNEQMVQAIRKLPIDRTVRVGSNQQGRPALVSYQVYGTVDLWFVILEYNGLIQNELTVGRIINLPSRTDVDRILKTWNIILQGTGGGHALGINVIPVKRTRVVNV